MSCCHANIPVLHVEQNSSDCLPDLLLCYQLANGAWHKCPPLSRHFKESKCLICMRHIDEVELISYYLYSNLINHMLAFPPEHSPKHHAASAGFLPNMHPGVMAIRR